MRRIISRTLVIGGLLAAISCGGDTDRRGTSRSHGGPGSVTFHTLEEFLESPARSAHAATPVVFVGIDGAAWGYIDPLIEQGVLPNLARLRREGATGPLRSIPCYVSPPSWATMFTGDLPEKTGVYTYGRWDRDAREFTSVDGADVITPTMWEVASHLGARVGIFNAPMSYPPSPVNGTMVTGMMTPHRMLDPPHTRPLPRERSGAYPRRAIEHSYSPVRRTATTDSLNVYLWALYDSVNDGRVSYDRVALDVYSAGPAEEVQRYSFDVGHFSPWVRIRVVVDGEVGEGWCRFSIFEAESGRHDTRISPVLLEPDGDFTYPEGFASELRDRFGFYTPSIFLGRDVVADMAGDAAKQASFFYNMDDWDLFVYVFTQSDNAHHLTGFSTVARQVYRTIDRFIGTVMASMPETGVLIVASDHGFSEYEYGINLNAWLEQLGLLEFNDAGRIDYERSVVFHNLWNLYFNDDLLTRGELEKRGIDPPAGRTIRDVLMEYLQTVLSALEWRGVPYPIELSRYPDAAAGNVPDMLVRGTYDNYLVDFLGFEDPHEEVFRRLEGRERWWHKREGIYAAWGNGVERGRDADGRDIQDIAPTIMYLLGLPLSKQLDGRIMHDAFESQKRELFVDDYRGLPEAPVATGAERESLEKKLRSLGYLQ